MRHPYLIPALEKAVGASPERELELFRHGVRKIIKDHLEWMSDWLESSRNLFNKLGATASKADNDDIQFCLFAIEEWENEDRAAGMRYNALCKRFNTLMTAERKQILQEELDKQEKKIEELAEKANFLAESWLKKLEKHPHDPAIAKPLNWLAGVTAEELKGNYVRWEKEKL
jgi:hypothetical protein